ncbi:12373_t:CDS:2 [Ambispora leptoticha]|uniref:12373_t:CDS:1 n=1 Tax=Ambispora leptoticha TaxID=144679 RepID=A0A9N9AU23_9GLOM|nr:12373_t:CDS:2 [Ambispora leptoticha]
MAWASTKLKLSVAEPILFFRGTQEEANGCFLRGDLMLQLSKPSKFKKIELSFDGAAETRIPEGVVSRQGGILEKKEIISHKWTFLAPLSSSGSSSSSDPQEQLEAPKPSRFKFLNKRKSSKKTQTSHLLSSGVHTYPFELFLPGSTPETISTDFSIVAYKLSAKAFRAGLFPNLQISNTIELVRTQTDHVISQGINVSRNVEGIFNYEMTLPKSAYTLGSRIPIDLKVIPQIKKFRLYNVTIEILENQTYKFDSRQKFNGKRVVVTLKSDKFARTRLSEQEDEGDLVGNISYERTLSLQLPKCAGLASFSGDSPLVSVSHQLRVTFMVAAPNYTNKRLAIRLVSPITLLSCRCVDDHLTLPKYEEESYFCPCDPEYQRQARLILGASAFPEQPPPTEDDNSQPPPSYENIIAMDRLEMMTDDNNADTSSNHATTSATASSNNDVSMVIEMMDVDDEEDDDRPLSSFVNSKPLVPDKSEVEDNTV